MGHVEVFVMELGLERDGAWAIGCAKSLWQDVHSGQRLDPDQVATLIDVITTSPEPEVRRWTVKALTAEALRADRGDIVEAIARASDECLALCLKADVREPSGPRLLEAMLRVTAGADQAMQATLAKCFRDFVFSGTDVALASERLLALLGIPARGAGYKRVAPAAAATECIFDALVQDNAPRRRSDEGFTFSVDRAELEGRAVAAFGPELERLASVDDPAGHDARSLLVGVAAAKERWLDVDAHMAARRGSSGARALAFGLLRASHHVTFPLVCRDANDGPRAFVAEIVRRVMTLRPELRKPDLKLVDASLASQAYAVGLRLATDVDVPTLIAQLLAAPVTKKGHPSHFKLIDEIRANPALADLLPPIADVPATGPRGVVAALQLQGLLLRGGDRARVRAHFEELVANGQSLVHAIAFIANTTVAPLGPHLALIAPLVDHDDSEYRWWASYYVRHVAKERTELAPWAPAILRRITDMARPGGKGEAVAVEGRQALRAALEVTADRAAFVTAARQLLGDAPDAKTRTALRTQLRESLPEALVAAPGKE